MKKIISEILSYSSVAGISYANLYVGAIVAILIYIGKFWYGYKQRTNPIEDIQEYYENGTLKRSTKKYRQ